MAPVLTREGRDLAGYVRAVRGEELEYHSPLPAATRSLLVRSEERARGIAWETAPVPAGNGR